MTNWLVGHAGTLGVTAAKAVLIYLVALFGLRLAHRRTLAQWTAIDFAAAIATGAIMGRTAIASSQSFAVGAAALVTFLAAHTAITFARYRPLFSHLLDHRVRVLVAHGRIRRDQLLVCGLTEADLLAQLRQSGVRDVSELRYVLFEAKGGLTVVRDRTGEEEGLVVRAGLEEAAGYR